MLPLAIVSEALDGERQLCGLINLGRTAWKSSSGTENASSALWSPGQRPRSWTQRTAATGRNAAVRLLAALGLLGDTADGVADTIDTYVLTRQRELDACIATRYIPTVIKSFRHKGIEKFFFQGTKAGIQAAHAGKLARQLQRLDVARLPQDMNVPGWKLHPLKGALKGQWAVWVSGNWRLTFAFEGENAVLVDYQDYH